jgi:hypothetical protein
MAVFVSPAEHARQSASVHTHRLLVEQKHALHPSGERFASPASQAPHPIVLQFQVASARQTHALHPSGLRTVPGSQGGQVVAGQTQTASPHVQVPQPSSVGLVCSPWQHAISVQAHIPS